MCQGEVLSQEVEEHCYMTESVAKMGMEAVEKVPMMGIERQNGSSKRAVRRRVVQGGSAQGGLENWRVQFTNTPMHQCTNAPVHQYTSAPVHQHQHQHTQQKPDWPKLDWPKLATAPKGGGPEGWGSKISRFFSLSRQ